MKTGQKKGRTSKGLTKKQRDFARGKAAGLNDAEAARQAGYSESVALNAGEKIGSNAQVQAYYRELMQTAAPPKRLVAKISEHIEGKSVTTKVVRTRVPISGPRGKARYETQVRVERTDTTDAGVSLRAIEMAQDIAGYLPRKGPDVAITLEAQMGQMTDAELADIVTGGRLPQISDAELRFLFSGDKITDGEREAKVEVLVQARRSKCVEAINGSDARPA